MTITAFPNDPERKKALSGKALHRLFRNILVRESTPRASRKPSEGKRSVVDSRTTVGPSQLEVARSLLYPKHANFLEKLNDTRLKRFIHGDLANLSDEETEVTLHAVERHWIAKESQAWQTECDDVSNAGQSKTSVDSWLDFTIKHGNQLSEILGLEPHSQKPLQDMEGFYLSIGNSRTGLVDGTHTFVIAFVEIRRGKTVNSPMTYTATGQGTGTREATTVNGFMFEHQGSIFAVAKTANEPIIRSAILERHGSRIIGGSRPPFDLRGLRLTTGSNGRNVEAYRLWCIGLPKTTTREEAAAPDLIGAFSDLSNLGSFIDQTQQKDIETWLKRSPRVV
jgi:hypothetical protein